jgi:hypothetical protein
MSPGVEGNIRTNATHATERLHVARILRERAGQHVHRVVEAAELGRDRALPA